MHERPMVSLLGDHVSDIIRVEGIYERPVLELLRDCLFDRNKVAAQVAIDVGANIGNHSLFFSDIFARVIAFEPNPLARSLLNINLDMNEVSNVEVRPVGLSDRAGKADLNFDHKNIGAATTRTASGQNRQAEIELVVGDKAIDGSEPIGFIKIDVEGAEEAVLRGLERTIRSHRPLIMIEQWTDVIDASAGTSPSVSFLRELGYEAWEPRLAGLFAGKLGKLVSLALGRADYNLNRVERLEKREYPALIFTPSGYRFARPV